ncbi:hypothetical protein OC842_007250 [Tilletia horrida]|uniref:Uncharacterized protein n=1 Tax=Tilletia horrida TaxID=155126 RepID=A0AAN6JH55_9BASI|nr:hypothetical protein OC842_007250 [Tilletia horrida]
MPGSSETHSPGPSSAQPASKRKRINGDADFSKIGADMLRILQQNPDSIVLELTGDSLARVMRGMPKQAPLLWDAVLAAHKAAQSLSIPSLLTDLLEALAPDSNFTFDVFKKDAKGKWSSAGPSGSAANTVQRVRAWQADRNLHGRLTSRYHEPTALRGIQFYIPGSQAIEVQNRKSSVVTLRAPLERP